VTDPEPLPKGNALWKFSNVVITPHTSGGSDHLQARTNALDRRTYGGRRGVALLNVVDKKEGF